MVRAVFGISLIFFTPFRKLAREVISAQCLVPLGAHDAGAVIVDGHPGGASCGSSGAVSAVAAGAQ
jgi:hypothetical protein